MAVRVICINKDYGDHYDPHEGITHLGWVNENTGKRDKCTRADMVAHLEKGNQAYVKDALGGRVYLEVRVSRAGNKYVKTVANGRETDNLLALPECRM